MTGSATPRRRFGRYQTAANRLGGFGLSTILLAAASLAATPAMISADGPAAWGAIAVGQAIGAIASLIASYGWAVSGPAAIARGDSDARRREYSDSLRVKLTLFWPCAVVAALLSALMSQDQPSFAVVGAVSATAVSLTSNWYFAGLARPYLWLLLETMPRVVGTAVGIALMLSGYSAVVGLICTTSGMVAAFCLVTTWVFRSTAHDGGAGQPPRSKLKKVLVSRRHGILSLVGSQMFLSAPLAIVSVVAPASLPVFALADKVRQLVGAGLSPVLVVLQGWVPRGAESENVRRGRLALGATIVFGLVFLVVFLTLAPLLMHWLGNGQIAAPQSLQVAVALVIVIGFFDSVLAYAVIVAIGSITSVARATAFSIAAMLPCVVVGAMLCGALGAMIGTVIGLAVRVGIELASIGPVLARRGRDADKPRPATIATGSGFSRENDHDR